MLENTDKFETENDTKFESIIMFYFLYFQDGDEDDGLRLLGKTKRLVNPHLYFSILKNTLIH